MPVSEISEAFVAKVDAFAMTLEPDEQVMLMDLLTAGADVTGFGSGVTWPGLINLDIAPVVSAAGAESDSLLAHELTHVVQGRRDGTKG